MLKSTSVFALLLLAYPAAAATIVAENGPHDHWNHIPFSWWSGTTRYQQVYASSLFSNPVQINALAFAATGSGDYTANIDMRLTTTPVAVGNLTTSFDSNFTTPLTTVFSDDSFFRNIPVGDPGSFDFVLAFDSPFSYDPLAGNLLLDIRISGQSSEVGLSYALAGAISSRAFETTGPENWGTGVSFAGMRTLFIYDDVSTVVPEPSSLLLTALGAAVILFRRKRSSPSRR